VRDSSHQIIADRPLFDMSHKILINAKWRAHAKTSGVQRYARGLSDAMDSSDLDVRWAEPSHSGRFRSALWEQRTLPKLAVDADILFCPANMAPIRTPEQVKLVVVIHCLRYHFHPESYPASFVRWYARMVPKIIRRADRVLTVSHAQSQEIEAVYPHARGKLGVVSPGLNPIFGLRPEPDLSAHEEPYLFCLSNSTRAKNLSVVFRALAEMPSAPCLVVAGITNSEADLMCPSSIRHRICPLGHVNDPARVAALIANAIALVSPSRYESFGLPCLEAMGCATPVIASDLPAHREVCGDGALFVHSDNPAAWADAITLIRDDAALCDSLSAAGQERARLFTWDRALEELKGEFERVAPQVMA
jgi:glycosyltransferase involved in cell wall biosynthesis